MFGLINWHKINHRSIKPAKKIKVEIDYETLTRSVPIALHHLMQTESKWEFISIFSSSLFLYI